STSSSSLFPAIKYAGRLSSDPVNTLPQTEVSLIDGTGSQSGSCGGTCHRWGDYSAMTLDPDGCTFWYTNEYYAVSGLNHHTRIGSFRVPSCSPPPAASPTRPPPSPADPPAEPHPGPADPVAGPDGRPADADRRPADGHARPADCAAR